MERLWQRVAGLACLALVLSPASGGEIFRWVDEKGGVHFGDRPPAETEAAEVRLRINSYESPDIQALEESFYSAQQVVMYSAAWCGVCRKAKRYFHDNGISFVEYDVEKSEKGRRDFARLGGRGVPIILVGDRRMNGFSAEAFQRMYRAR